jgi:hypothetical protein
MDVAARWQPDATVRTGYAATFSFVFNMSTWW